MQERHHRYLLAVDAAINAVLGLCLLAIPGWTISFFGLPKPGSYFYASVLGAVLLGIGIALWIERRGMTESHGLGLAGAVIINILGAGTVLVWLLLDPFELPTRGYVVLWVVVLAVLGTGIAELAFLLRRLLRRAL